MAKYSLTISIENAKDVKKIATLADVITFDSANSIGSPDPDDVIVSIEWFLEQLTVIGDTCWEDGDLDDFMSWLERKCPSLRKRISIEGR